MCPMMLFSLVAVSAVINSSVHGKFQTLFSIPIPAEVVHNSSHTKSTLQNATVLFPMMNGEKTLKYPYCGLDGFDLNDKYTLEFRANYTAKRVKAPLENLAELQCQNSTLCDQNRTALFVKCVNQGLNASVNEWKCQADFDSDDIRVQAARISCERLYSQCVTLKSCVLLYTPIEHTPDWHMFVAWSVGVEIALVAMSVGIYAVRRRSSGFVPTTTTYLSTQKL